MRVLTLARDLARRRARERDGLFVAEGVRAVEELIRSPVTTVGILCGPQLVDTQRGAQLRAEIERLGTTISDVSEREFASAASTESPQGVLAVAQIPQRSLSEFAGRKRLRLLVLDAVQDPGNVGTLLRTAHALGIDGTLALQGTVDLWNAKVVRSAMGSHFRHSAFSASLEDLVPFLGDHGISLWGADVKGAPITELSAPPSCALAVGNEGAGLTDAVRAVVGQLVSLPMQGDADSLNVAVAAGILLFEMRT